MRIQTLPEPIAYTSFNGALPGYITDAFTFPGTDHTLIIFDNTEQFNHSRMAADIYKILQGESYEMLKPLVADILGRKVLKDGISRTVKTYKDMKQNNRQEYDFDSIDSILADQGYLLADAGLTDDAVIIFKLIIELNPNSPKAYNDLGKIYEHIGKTDLSNNAFEKAEDLEKRDQLLFSYLKNGEFEKARILIEKIQNETPSEALFASSQIGPLFSESFGSGKIEEAIQICELWALGNPAEVGPYFSLARIYQQLGNSEEAIRCYEKVLEISPTGRHVSTAKMRLEELKKKISII